MTFYFERNGYDVNFVSRHDFDKVESFERGVLSAVGSNNKPFLSVVDFGRLGTDSECEKTSCMRTDKLMAGSTLLFPSYRSQDPIRG